MNTIPQSMPYFRRWLRSLAAILATAICSIVPVYSLLPQVVGDQVKMESTNPLGPPVHPAAGNNSFVRWANGTMGVVTAVDAATGWLQVRANGQSGWVVRTYLTVLATEPEQPTPAEIPFVVVGTWNIEYLADDKTRGFPENGQGGPSYAPRTLDDYRYIAEIITSKLFARVLVLNEINGKNDGTSAEMDRLVGCLGPTWKYRQGTSGGSQRITVLHDSSVARLVKWVEVTVPEVEIQKSDIFARDPVLGKFLLLDASGKPKNDFVVVGVHLASGQQLNTNHNAAMGTLRTLLKELIATDPDLVGERDVLIMGDFNASRYDAKQEDFWTGYDSDGFNFRTLSPDDAEDYPGTRLAGVPLIPQSRIDYILASGQAGGMLDHIVQLVAQVHTELLPDVFTEFRRRASDHLPVTARVLVTQDDD